jgi:hypothetical protein
MRLVGPSINKVGSGDTQLKGAKSSFTFKENEQP